MNPNTEGLYLSIGRTARRYGRCTRTITRWWLENKETGFPEPIKIAKTRYWFLPDLERWGALSCSRKDRDGG
jgi:hypothetical protein